MAQSGGGEIIERWDCRIRCLSAFSCRQTVGRGGFFFWLPISCIAIWCRLFLSGHSAPKCLCVKCFTGFYPGVFCPNSPVLYVDLRTVVAYCHHYFLLRLKNWMLLFYLYGQGSHWYQPLVCWGFWNGCMYLCLGYILICWYVVLYPFVNVYKRLYSITNI